MSKEAISTLLGEHSVRTTPNRILVAEALSEAGRPVSLSELEDILPSMDKSSIFRCLSLFRDVHLVHVIEDGGDGLRYELCHCHESDHDDDLHAHFYCERCRKTFCLEDIPVPEVDLPEGYLMTSVNYLVKGICPDCAKVSGR